MSALAASRRRGGDIAGCLWPAAAAAVLAAAVVLLGPCDARFAAAAVLTLFLPGYALARCIPGPGPRDRFETAVLGCGLSIAIVISIGFIMNRSGCIIAPVPVALVLAGVCAAGSLLALRAGPRLVRAGPCLPRDRRDTVAVVSVVLLMAVAALYRFTFLGYSEFQGDEAKVLVKVQEMLAGDHRIIFEHKKGPGELLVCAVTGVAFGRVNELGSRLPFAAAALAAVGAVFLTGRLMFSRRTGLIAGLIVAVNGYLIAFARIAQYQSLIVLLVVLCLYCLCRAGRTPGRDASGGRAGSECYLLAAAFLLSAAFLTHYEVAPSVPALVLALAALFWRRGSPGRPRGWVVALLAAGVVAAAASFYVPLRLSDHWPVFWSYLSDVRVGTFRLRDNIGRFIIAGSLYTGLYQLIVLGVLALVAFFSELARARVRRWVLVALLAAALAAVIHGSMFPTPQVLADRVLRLAGSVFFLCLLLVSPRTRLQVRILFLWVGPYLLLYGFFMYFPGTHWYLLFPGIALICGEAASWLWDAHGSRLLHARLLRARGARVAGLLAGAAAVAVLAYYPYMIFVRHSVEYIVTYPENRSRLFFAPEYVPAYADGRTRLRLSRDIDELPTEGIFGFPHRDGWRTLGWLFKSGELAGAYKSNEQAVKAQWYLGQESKGGPFPARYLVISGQPQPEYAQVRLKTSGYRRRCTLRDGGRDEIRVYEIEAFGLPPLVYGRDEFAVRYEDVSTIAGLARDQRRGNRRGDDDTLEGYWSGRFREPGDPRTARELRGADRDALARVLTREYQEKEMRTETGLETVRDPLASNRKAFVFRDGQNAPGVLAYGPYRRYPAGSYVARFWLRGEGKASKDAAVRLDVTGDGGDSLLAGRTLRADELAGAGGYRSFALPFENPVSEAGLKSRPELEFRVECTGGLTVFFDRVEVSADLAVTDELK